MINLNNSSSNQIQEIGYSASKKRLMRFFRLSLIFQKRILTKHFEKGKINKWLKASLTNLEELIPELPWIGGKGNIFSQFLVRPSMLLPIVQILHQEGVPTRKIGQIMFEMAEKGYFLFPRPIRWWQRRKYFKKGEMQKWRDAAAKTQEQQYSADWVCEFVEGDRETFQYGLDMKECGLLKFWSSKGLEDFVPYLCLADWALWNSLGVQVQRTKTLANGGDCCDYRYIRLNKDVVRGWPPESLPEWTGKFEKKPKAEKY